MYMLDEVFDVRMRTMQIISAALILVVVTFTLIAVAVVNENDGPLGHAGDPNAPPLISVIALVMLGTCVVVRFVLLNSLLRRALQRIAMSSATPPTPKQCAGFETFLLGVHQNLLIAANALLEAPALFCAIAYLIEGRPWVLAGVAIALVLMLWQFPTHGTMRAWLERHLELVLELQQLGAP
jgi:hypothetical protein